MWRTVQECGFPALLMLLLGGLGTIAAIAALVVALTGHRAAAKVVSAVALVLGLSCLGLSVVGVLYGRMYVDGAVSGASLDATARERIRQQSYAEANQCLVVGAGTGVVPLLLGATALLLVLARRAQAGRPS